MTNILFDVQSALFARIENVPELPQIYDHVPANCEFPFIVYGPVHLTPQESMSNTYFEQIIAFDIWSRYRGGKETRVVFQKLFDALHRATFAIAGHRLIKCEFHSADFAIEADGATYHAAARFSVTTETGDT